MSVRASWVWSPGPVDLHSFPRLVLPNLFFLFFCGGGRLLGREREVPVALSTGAGDVNSDARGDDASVSVAQDSVKAMIVHKVISVTADALFVAQLK